MQDPCPTSPQPLLPSYNWFQIGVITPKTGINTWVWMCQALQVQASQIYLFLSNQIQHMTRCSKWIRHGGMEKQSVVIQGTLSHKSIHRSKFSWRKWNEWNTRNLCCRVKAGTESVNLLQDCSGLAPLYTWGIYLLQSSIARKSICAQVFHLKSLKASNLIAAALRNNSFGGKQSRHCFWIRTSKKSFYDHLLDHPGHE